MENKFHEMLLQRHSIRRYTPEPIDPEHVRLILEAGLLAPTSKSSRSWNFIVVDDKDMLMRLADCKDNYATSLKSAPLAVVVATNPSKSGAWIEDGSVAAIMMQLQAQTLGLGSCWVEMRGRATADGTPSEQAIRELLGIPDELEPMVIVTFGHPDEQRRPVDPSKLLWEQVHLGTFRQLLPEADE